MTGRKKRSQTYHVPNTRSSIVTNFFVTAPKSEQRVRPSSAVGVGTADWKRWQVVREGILAVGAAFSHGSLADATRLPPLLLVKSIIDGKTAIGDRKWIGVRERNWKKTHASRNEEARIKSAAGQDYETSRNDKLQNNRKLTIIGVTNKIYPTVKIEQHITKVIFITSTRVTFNELSFRVYLCIHLEYTEKDKLYLTFAVGIHNDFLVHYQPYCDSVYK